MGINVQVKRKITVDGKDYESLDDVPPDARTAILKTLAHGRTNTKTTIHVNGKTYSSVEDLPAPLRAVVRGITSMVVKGGDVDALRPEPILSKKIVVVAIALAAMLFWLARVVL